MAGDGDTNNIKSPTHKQRSVSLGKERSFSEIDIAVDTIIDEDGTEQNKSNTSHFSLYKFYLSFVEQDQSYTTYVSPLPAHATLWDRIKWYIAYPLRQEKPITKWLWVSIGFYLFCTVLHIWATRVVFYLHKGGPRLFDMGFAALPELDPQYKVLSEIFFNCIFITTLVCVALHPQRFRIFTRVLFMFGFLYLCRSMSFLATVLPSPATHCDVTSPNYTPPRKLVEIFFQISFTAGCGDLIFSGHTLHSTTAVLLWMKYCKNILAKIIMGSALITLYFLIIAARKHYTIDVLVAAYLVPFVFLVYTDRFEPWLYRNVKKRKQKAEEHDSTKLVGNGKETYGSFIV